MKQPRIIAAALVLAFAIEPNSVSTQGGVPESQVIVASLDTLRWLAGCWEKTHSDGRRVHEAWMKPAGDNMPGMSRTAKEGRVVESEFLRIVRDTSGVVRLLAHPTGQSPAVFRLVNLVPHEAVFANPLHDFPQRIAYRRIGSDSLSAWIEGTRNGTPRRIAFPYRRTRCE